MKKIMGIHSARAMLEYRANEVHSVLLSSQRTDKRLSKIEALAIRNGLNVVRATNSELSAQTSSNKHQGVLLLCDTAKSKPPPSMKRWLSGLPQNSSIIVLDSITDPRNFGACIRSANAAGAKGIIVPKHRGCKVNTTVSRTATGAAEITPIFEVSNLARTLDFLKENGYWIVGLHPDTAQSLFEIDLNESCVFVFGNEGTGLRKETQKKCDTLVRVPMFGQIESLNVSVTVGVAMFEAARQRMYDQS